MIYLPVSRYPQYSHDYLLLKYLQTGNITVVGMVIIYLAMLRGAFSLMLVY